MILESAQLLSTAHRLIDGIETVQINDKGRRVRRWVLDDHRDPIIYTATHVNHPSAVWVRQSVENYLWLVDHFYALIDEHQYRYGDRRNFKPHKCRDIAYYLQSPPNGLKNYDWTRPVEAMDAKYIISDDYVENYRNYYREGKKHLHRWTKRPTPEWI